MKKPKAAATGKPSTDQPEEEYKPTPREQEAIKAFNIGIDHKDPFTGQMLLMQALGVTDFDFAAGI